MLDKAVGGLQIAMGGVQVGQQGRGAGRHCVIGFLAGAGRGRQ